MTNIQRRRMAMMGTMKNGLPSAYQEVEYIESTGTQYLSVDMGSVFEHIVIKGKFLITSVKRRAYVFRAEYFAFYIENVYGRLRLVNYTQNYGYVDSIRSEVNKTYDFSAEQTDTQFILVLNGVLYSGSRSYVEPIQSQYINFFTALADDPVYFLPMRLYKTEIYDGTNIKNRLVPCYRKSDNEIGMYDIINQHFYENSGTGVFLKGADV